MNPLESPQTDSMDRISHTACRSQAMNRWIPGSHRVLSGARLMICLLLAWNIHSFRPTSAAEAKPNVLMIAVDDLNDWVGFLGGHPQVKTPNMDRLAARGVVFDNAHCQSPLCNPSRTSLLLGKRPSSTGIYGLAPFYAEVDQLQNEMPLTQYFKDHGYQTYSGGKVFHGGYPPAAWRQRIADHWGPAATVGAKPDRKIITTPGGNHPLMDWGTFPHQDEDKGDWAVASWAVTQLSTMPVDRPFFLQAGFFLPHVPCYASPKWFDLYPDDELVLPEILAGDRQDTPRFSWYLHWKLPEPRFQFLREADQWRPLVRSYLACVSFVDSQVGRILDALDQSTHSQNTIVVLWSDHGYHLGEKAISGKNSLWSESTRVPLVFAGPGVGAAGVCHQPVELLDIYPTLVQLCRLPGKRNLDGHSLVPQLRDVSVKRPWPAITTHNHNNHSIRSLHHRFIQYADGSEEFYDCQSDPNEWNNLIGQPQYRDLIGEHRLWLPQENSMPAPGSQHRILTWDKDQATWEGEPIHPLDPIPEITH